MNASYEVRTPPGVGAIAAIDLVGDVDGALREIGVASVRSGSVALRDLAGVDRGVVARWDRSRCTIMPHGGAAVVSALCDEFERAGVRQAALAPLDAFPEASDEFEALALQAIARAESPRAIDLLLDQARRWRAWRGEPGLDALRRTGACLNHLLRAPLVVAIGATNIGKSSLLNALARREVSIVHDAPGVTRDHVGASLVLDGLAVRWIDAPGIIESSGSDDRNAIERALLAARGADALLLCADHRSAWPEPASLGLQGIPAIRVGLRADLGLIEGADVSTAAATGLGLDDLARAIRVLLTPDRALLDPSPWLFDDRLAATLSFPTDFSRS